MVRPNGSVIGRESDAAGVGEGPVIQYASSLRQSAIISADSRFRNAQSMHDAHGIQSAVGAVQAISGWARRVWIFWRDRGRAMLRPSAWVVLAFSASWSSAPPGAAG